MQILTTSILNSVHLTFLIWNYNRKEDHINIKYLTIAIPKKQQNRQGRYSLNFYDFMPSNSILKILSLMLHNRTQKETETAIPSIKQTNLLKTATISSTSVVTTLIIKQTIKNLFKTSKPISQKHTIQDHATNQEMISFKI